MIETLLAISVAAGVWSMGQPSAGTYALSMFGVEVVRMDTRTGAVERCTLVGNTLHCKAVVAGETQTTAAK